MPVNPDRGPGTGSPANPRNKPAAIGSIKGLDTEQQNNANIIVQVGKNLGMSSRDIAIAIMTAMDESSLHNLSGGDRDSIGLFQQRSSQGWGTKQQEHDPRQAATMFFNALKLRTGRDKISPWAAAQSVQNSAFPDGSNYRVFWDSGGKGFQVGATDIASYFLHTNIPIGSTGGTSDGAISGHGTVGTGTIVHGAGETPIIKNPDGSFSPIDPSGAVIEGPKYSAYDLMGLGLRSVGSVMDSILWIFNVDNFMKFLLYMFGAIAVVVGLGLVSFGAGKSEEALA